MLNKNTFYIQSIYFYNCVFVGEHYHFVLFLLAFKMQSILVPVFSSSWLRVATVPLVKVFQFLKNIVNK